MSTAAIIPNGVLRKGNATIQRADPRSLEGEPWYLFNIYSTVHDANLGTVGWWTVPACPEDKEWIRAVQIVPAVIPENWPHFQEGENYPMTLRYAEDIVACILGRGVGQDRKAEDVTRFGINASKNKTPTKAELDKWNADLNAYLSSVVAEGDRLASSADAADRGSVNTKHYRAARKLRVTRPWLSDTTQAMVACPFCSTSMNPKASVCQNCHQIVNKAAFDAVQKQIAGTV